MAEEGEAQLGVAAHPVESLIGDSGGFVESVGAEVGEFFGFECAPDLLDGVDFMGAAGQPLDSQPASLTSARSVLAAASRLDRLLAQPFHLAEAYTGTPGQTITTAQARSELEAAIADI